MELKTAGISLVALVLLAALPLAAQTYPLNEQTAVANPTNTTFGVTRGYEFNTNNPGGITVVELGCFTPESATVANTVTLWERQTTPTAAWIMLAQETVTPGPGWRWAPLTTPVHLQQGTNYAVKVFANSLYGWSSGAPVSWRPTGTVNYVNGLWRNQTTSANDPCWTSSSSIQATGHQGHADIGYTTGPVLGVTPDAGTPAVVHATDQGPGGQGLQAAKFTIASNADSGAVLVDIDVTASGTGDDSTAYTEIAIYRDDDSSGDFTPGVDVLIDSVNGGFPTDDGVLTFTPPASEPAFGSNDSRTYFIVVKLSGTAQPTETFMYAISNITVNNGNKALSATAMSGLEIATPEFVIADASAANPVTAYLGTDGNVCQAFTISYPGGPDDKPGAIVIGGTGTADESTDLSAVELWYDADDDGQFDAQLDTLLDTQNFTQDDGQVSFSIPGSHPDFQATDTRRYFVVYNLNVNADDGETFKSFVVDATGATHGAVASGVPAPGTAGTAGLEVSANALIATVNGPTTAMDVSSNATGATGDGELLLDITLSATAGGAWDVSSLTFSADGTGSHDGAYSELALYEDDGNTTWDGAGTDTLAAAVAGGFSGGTVTFNLNSTAFAASQDRRFFLTGKLNGTALSGQTFNALLESVNATPPTGGVTVGIPSAPSTALIIDVASLTVSAGAAQPQAVSHAAGTVAGYVVADIRLAALNSAVDVSGITLTGSGSGDWSTDVDSVEVYLDDGDGVFDDTLDAQLYQSVGSATITATFGSVVNIAVATTENLWVRVVLNAGAGSGAVSAPDTFQLAIATAGDVSASSNVVIGTPAPAGIVLGAIAFEVTSFAPTGDLPAGGKPITIQGSGFVSPFSVTIDGVPCPGTANISGGTQVTGLTVPPGGGRNREIVVHSGNLPPQVLSQKFSYSNVGSTGGSGGGDGGCVAAGAPGAAWLLLGLGGLVGLRRRTARTR